MAGGRVYTVATVLPAGTLGDAAAAGVYTNAVPRPSTPGRAGFTGPGAVPGPGVAASPAARQMPRGIPASLAGCRRGS
jgi:hypothetical protein